MKQIKKLVAALLVGVMALALFTACGSTIPPEIQKAENAILAAMNEQRPENDQLTNSMTAQAKAALARIDENGKIRWKEVVSVENVIGTEQNKSTVTFVFAKGFNVNNVLQPDTTVTLNAMRYDDPKLAEQVNRLTWMAPYMSKFGVAVDQQTGYVAIAFEINYDELSAQAKIAIKAWIGAHTPALYD